MKIGDRVIVNGEWDGLEFNNSKGEFIAGPTERRYLIEFDEHIGGLVGLVGSAAKPGHGWWLPKYMIEKEDTMNGCKFRKYHRHDGATEFLCTATPGYCCVNDFDDYYENPSCKFLKGDTAEERIEALEKELAELKACQKYAPVLGDYVVMPGGEIVKATFGWEVWEGSKVGNCFDTKEKAVKARDIMVKHDIILKYVIDHAPDYAPDWTGVEKNYCVTYCTDEKEWHVRDNDYLCDIGTIFMPYWVAEKLADDLNNNRIEGM